jgi:hypothetical protein
MNRTMTKAAYHEIRRKLWALNREYNKYARAYGHHDSVVRNIGSSIGYWERQLPQPAQRVAADLQQKMRAMYRRSSVEGRVATRREGAALRAAAMAMVAAKKAA